MALQPNSMRLRVKDFDDYRAPARRPWLPILVVFLVVLLAFGAWRRWRGGRDGTVAPEVVSEAGVSEGAYDAPGAVAEAGRDSARRRAPDTSRPDVGATHARMGALSAEEIRERLARARDMVADGRLLEARDLYFKVLNTPLSDAVRRDVEQRLGALNIELVTNPHMMPEKVEYTIARGDALRVIAPRFGTTIDLIHHSNRITNPNRINIGDRLRLLDNPKFEIRVGKHSNDLLLTLNGRFFKRYSVGTGEYGRTPEGTFVIGGRNENPTWWRPDGREVPFGHPDNILGTRWMSLAATGDTPPIRGYGIHGTWDDTSIGTQSSAGCVRMRNAEVEELFMLVTDGTPVTIVK